MHVFESKAHLYEPIHDCLFTQGLTTALLKQAVQVTCKHAVRKWPLCSDSSTCTLDAKCMCTCLH